MPNREPPQKRFFPSEGCEKAFNCGKEFVVHQVPQNLLNKALEFCETAQEEYFFLMGCKEEALDLESLDD